MKNIIRDILYNYRYMLDHYSFSEYIETVIHQIENEFNKPNNTGKTETDEDYFGNSFL